MPKFTVHLNCVAMVSTIVVVDADTKDEAEIKAFDTAKAGDVVWRYNQLTSDDIEVDYVLQDNRKYE